MTRSALANSFAGCLAAAGLTAIVGVGCAGAAAAVTPVPPTPITATPITTAPITSARATPAPTGAPSTAAVAEPPPGIEVPAGNVGQVNSGGGTSDAEIVLVGLGVLLAGGAGVVGVRRR